jgi:hypothetical protein
VALGGPLANQPVAFLGRVDDPELEVGIAAPQGVRRTPHPPTCLRSSARSRPSHLEDVGAVADLVAPHDLGVVDEEDGDAGDGEELVELGAVGVAGLPRSYDFDLARIQLGSRLCFYAGETPDQSPGQGLVKQNPHRPPKRSAQ